MDRNFEEDLIKSNNPNLRNDWLRIFKLKFGDDCEVIWKDDNLTQKGMGTDVVIKTKKGRRYSIELKTRNYKVLNDNRWIMEIVSHIYNRKEKPRTRQYSKEGWIYSTTAEYLFHATLDETGERILETIFYSLIPFKTTAYKSEFNKYEKHYLNTQFPGSYQLTINKLIPKEIIKRDAIEFWEWCKND